MTTTELSYRSNNDLRRQNLADILRIVHHSNGATRSEIASETGLNRSTVLDLLNSLEQRGLVVQSQNSGGNEIGRPSITVSTSNKIVSIAVLPRLSQLDLAVVGLGGTIITQARLPLAKGVTAEQAAKKASGWIESIRETLPEGTLISGIGVAAAGPVRFGKGEIRFAPSLNWNEVPFVELLEKDTELPVAMDNDAGLWCSAEQRFGVGRGHQNMVLLIGVNGGIGGGGVVNGEVVRGHDGYAGEFGHMRISDSEQLDYSGIPGTLEAMVRREDIVSTLGLGEVDDEQLFIAISQSNSASLDKLLKSHINYLGRAIGILLNIYNPEVLVLAGFLETFIKLKKEELLESIRSQSLHFSSENLEIVTGTRGNDLLAVGVAELGFQNLMQNPLQAELISA
jgi:predicted NBD/HSP70 family sugar kinase/predicted transcriptional regulator